MNNVIIKPNGSPESTEAMSVYFGIENAKAQAANAMVELCRNLKTMRDKKLYTHLGFDKFEDYVEQAHGIKQRWAYTHIQTYEKLTPQLIAENADLGITKLSLLCQVSAIDREDFVEQNDLAKMTVKEIEALIEEKNGLHQQVSLLETAAGDEKIIQEAQTKEIERLKKELDEKNKTIADLSAEPQTLDVVAVETEKIDAAVAAERARAEKEKAKNKLDKQKKDLEEQQKAEAESLVADAVAKAKAEWQAQQTQQQSQLQQAVIDAQNKAAALEKQLAIKGDDKLVRFSILFEQVQADLINCVSLVDEIATENPSNAEKYKAMLRQACEMALGGD
ncbi:MAG: hypothetical protein IJN27_02425 [Oscillospiraceae bacterium]|nr:hypothetical protein [Oscillospiraceae bacterium]